ncbi:ABC transporter ATP-binding protein [Patescibacteria group bacterium]|nr:ABC transporter ATP-binding protein [Patescibacteria group bacterium]MBU1075437.1 ABC transporter ATP-binding protein [Patescibacteria group bacterium]MBU1952006.1 ABC transporter ATP-binding protein [Patescibacteria group bacterium]
MSIIEVKELTKKFRRPDKKGDLIAVDGISFSVEKGEIFGLLGPNGAGKTTTLEIIEGLQPLTGGETFIKDISTQKDLNKVKNLIGIQLQSSAYYEYLRLGEILELFGTFYNKALDPDKLLDIVQLKDKKKAMIKQLSGGQQQRFSICAALVNDPEIVFLDEPTTGLDPQARRSMWEFIKKINEQGKTVVITTHYMEEAEYLCNRVGIMDEGKIVSLNTPKALIRNLKSSARINFYTDEQFDHASLEAINGVLAVEKNSNNTYHLRITHSNEVLPKLYKWAEKNNVFMQDLEVDTSDLEDVFLELTGKKLRD